MTSKTPKQIIFENFSSMNSELPISGGWGRSLDDVCHIEIDQLNPSSAEASTGADIQAIFVEKRIYFELNISQPLEKKYSGIKWLLKNQEILHSGSRVYEKLIFKITAFLDKDFKELTKEWKDNDGYSSNTLSLTKFIGKSDELKIKFESEFWFDITSCWQYSISDVLFPWIISDFKRGVFNNYEIKNPGSGYSFGYNYIATSSEDNNTTATIYLYDSFFSGVHDNIFNPFVVEQFDNIKDQVYKADKILDRKSNLLKTFSLGGVESEIGFLAAIFEVHEFGEIKVSALFLSVYENNFVKLRITTLSNDTAIPKILGFVNCFSKILWGINFTLPRTT